MPGVLDANGELMPELTRAQVAGHIADGVISGGMIPKVQSCLGAMDLGVARAMIVDGRKAGNLADCLLNRGGVGTAFK